MNTKILSTWLLALLLVLPCTVSAQDWNTLFDKTDSLHAAGNFPEALLASKHTLQQAETEFGKNHRNYALSLSIIGSIQVSKGDYTDAQVSLEDSRDLFIKQKSTLDTNYINLLYHLALLSRIQGKYAKSEAVYKEALELAERLTGRESVDYSTLQGSLGVLYLVSQNYVKAEALLLEVLAMKEKSTGKQSKEYAATLSSLGQLYTHTENYSFAETYFQEAIRIRENVLGPTHPTLGFTLNNLGYLYMQEGSYVAAIRLFNRVISLTEKNASDSQLYLTASQNIAKCYLFTEQYEKAGVYFEKVKTIIGEKMGKDHPDYAAVLTNLANFRKTLGDYQEVESQHQQALKIYTARMGVENAATAEMLADIAEAKFESGKGNGVDSLYKMALTISQKVLGPKSLIYAKILNRYALFLAATQQIDSSIAAAGTVQTLISQNLTQNFLYQTNQQKQGLLEKWIPAIQTAFRLSCNHSQRADAAGIAYTGTVFLKNLLLSQYVNVFSDDIQVGSDNLRLLTDTLRLVNNSIASQYTRPVTQRKQLDSLEARAETLEKDLARQSAPYRAAQRALQIRWQDVRDALKPTEAAVEFVSFPYHNGVHKTDSVRYMALVLRPGDTAPQVVPLLTDEAPLRRLLARKSGVQGGAALYATRGSELDTDQLTKGDSLYQLIWQPLDKWLINTKTVYLSPSGLLHQVAFAALPYPDQKGNQYLADRYQLRQVGSTRQIVTPTLADDTYRSITSATLYGGIQYDSASVSPAPDQPGAWPFLPGSQREVTQIGQILGPKATQRTGAAATEVDFKAQSSRSPSVLHVATHGFAFSDPLVSLTDSLTDQGGASFRQIANPLFRTGLLMAGANRVWLGGRPAPGEDDGILTAYEVANLNLSNTKLVVLSACETALGDIRGSEGVFGLQRAFKMAGAGYLLTSLWPVSDQTTSDLMARFYQNWKRYKTIRAAYEKTQQQMRQKYPPSVWAAFVLIE